MIEKIESFMELGGTKKDITFLGISAIAFIMQLGGLLEKLTVANARAGIEKLVHLTPQTAHIISDGAEKMIPAEKVKVGDMIRVYPGETILVDGVIMSGTSSINQAVMTGESMPADKTVGDQVSSGTVNQFGSYGLCSCYYPFSTIITMETEKLITNDEVF